MPDRGAGRYRNTKRARALSVTRVMRDRVSLDPPPDRRANSYHFLNPSLSCKRPHTSTRSQFSGAQMESDLLALVVVGHSAGSKSDPNEQATEERKRTTYLMLSWTTTRELEDEERSGDLSASFSQHGGWKTKNSFTRYLHRRRQQGMNT
jgi:hypothetical protein